MPQFISLLLGIGMALFDQCVDKSETHQKLVSATHL